MTTVAVSTSKARPEGADAELLVERACPAARCRTARSGVGQVDAEPALASASSSSSFSASSDTCTFSRATLTSRPPPRAWRKNVRSPGSPTVPATNRSGGSNAYTWWVIPTTLSASPPRCRPRVRRASARAPGRRRARTRRRSAGVGRPRRRATAARRGASSGGTSGRRSPPVSLSRTTNGPGRGVPDHGHRGRVGHDPLEQVQVQAQRVGHDGLDHVAVAARQPQRVRAVLGGHRRVPVAGPRPPRGPPSPPSPRRPGTSTARRVLLHHLPQRVLGQLLERLALPVAVAALDRGRSSTAGVDAAAAPASRVCRQRISGLVTTAASGSAAQPLADRAGLARPGVVELDRQAAGEAAGGVGGGPAVPEQQDGGHARLALGRR